GRVGIVVAVNLLHLIAEDGDVRRTSTDIPEAARKYRALRGTDRIGQSAEIAVQRIADIIPREDGRAIERIRITVANLIADTRLTRLRPAEKPDHAHIAVHRRTGAGRAVWCLHLIIRRDLTTINRDLARTRRCRAAQIGRAS